MLILRWLKNVSMMMRFADRDVQTVVGGCCSTSGDGLSLTILACVSRAQPLSTAPGNNSQSKNRTKSNSD